MIPEYPAVVQEWTNDQIEDEMEIVLDIVNKLRLLRLKMTHNLSKSSKTKSSSKWYATRSWPKMTQLILIAPHYPCSSSSGELWTLAECEKLRRKRGTSRGSMMNASGYCENGPHSKQDEDVRKVAALLGELEIVDEAESKLHAN